MFGKISYRAQQLVTYSLGSCQVLPPWPKQIKVPYARGKVFFIPECWMGPRRAGTWCNSTISFNGTALWVWPCKEGSTTGTVHKQLSKNPRSTEKARNSSYCLCYTSLTLVKWSKTLCPQLPRLTPPDPPSSGISSGRDESNTLYRVSKAPSRFPDCFLLPADYNWLALLTPQWITLELSPLDPCAAQLLPALQEFTGRSACTMRTLQRSWNAPAMESETTLQPASQHWRRKG